MLDRIKYPRLEDLNGKSLVEIANIIADNTNYTIGSGAGQELRRWSPMEKRLAYMILEIED